MVLIAVRVHPFPSRTRKLSSPAPKILVWRRTGKIGNADTKNGLRMKSVFSFLKMIQNDISYYAMHTNFDAAPGCMADLAGERLGLKDTRVLELMGKTAEDKDYGIGIYGCFGRSMTLRETAEAVKNSLRNVCSRRLWHFWSRSGTRR